MTDKVQKIRKEIERRKSLIGNNSFLSDYEKGCNDGREDMCDELISIIDSLQEDPVNEDSEKAAEDYGIRQGAELKPFAIKYFKAGAKWKEGQLEKNRLEHYDAQTKEEKQLLLVDLCARLAYGVQVKVNIPYVNVDFDKDYDYITNLQNNCILTLNNISDIQKITDDIKPYLRPMSSMTEEEYNELMDIPNIEIYHNGRTISNGNEFDYLLSHHFDYRGLIEKGLALEAPEDMYNIKNK